jgi:Fe2+ transport system protein FeoA
VLSSLKVGESGLLVALELPPGVQNHLMYMGFVPDARVRVLHRAPSGDPTVYSVDGIEIALRHETSQAIWIAAQSIRNAEIPDDPQPATEDPEPELTEVIR